MFKLIQPRVGMFSRFAVTMVTLSAPQSLNSFDDTLCFRWGMVCQDILLNTCFTLSFSLSFALCHREYLIPYSFNYSSSILLLPLQLMLVTLVFWLSLSNRQMLFLLVSGITFSTLLPLHPSTAVVIPAHIPDISPRTEGFFFPSQAAIGSYYCPQGESVGCLSLRRW